MLKYVASAASLACCAVAQYAQYNSYGGINAKVALPSFRNYGVMQKGAQTLGKGVNDKVDRFNWQKKGLFKKVSAKAKAPVLRNEWWNSATKSKSLGDSTLKGKKALYRVMKFGNADFNPATRLSHRRLRRPLGHHSSRSLLSPLSMGMDSLKHKSKMSALSSKMSRFGSMAPRMSFSPRGKMRWSARGSLRRPRFVSIGRYLRK